jgi:DNA replication protein DnaC
LTEAEILAETLEAYEDSERRLELCSKCPETGGACANDHTTTPVGEKPTWADRKLVSAPCDRWGEFTIRRRLAASNVPVLFFDSSFGKFTRDLRDEDRKALFRFADVVATGARDFLVVTGERGSGKTRLSIALIRSLIRRAPRALFWYSDVTTIRNMLRQRYDDPESTPVDPFMNARVADVLVMDNVDPGAFKNEPWLNDRVEALVRDRWFAQRSTLILSHESLTEIAKIFSSVTNLSEAPCCSLQ